MAFDMKIVGLNKLQLGFRKFPKSMGVFVKQAIFAYANEVAKQARVSIRSGARSGKVYFINGRPHTASSPTEYPARIKRKDGLHDGIYWGRLSNGAEIISSADYSDYLESGTKYIKGSKTIKGVTFKGGRPFMRPALKEKEDYFAEKLNGAFTKAENQAFGGGAL